MGFKEVVLRETKKIFKSRLAIAITIFIPLTLCLMICLIFSQGSPKNLPVAVLVDDNSSISRMIVRYLNVMPSIEVKYRVSDYRSGNQLLTEGKVYGFVAIPKNFERDIYRLKQPSLLLYYNGQRILIGGIISKDITMLVQTISVGIDAKIRAKRGVPMSEAIKQAYLIKIDDHVRSNPYFNYQYFLSIVAFGHILQISMLLSAVWALGTEFKYGTAKEWLECANNSIVIAFLGKMFPYFCIFTTIFFILYFVYFVLLHAPYSGNILIGFIINIMFIITCLTMSAIFLIVARGNFRLALSSSAFYVAMGFAFAGVTFPVMSMPLAAKIYSAILPLSYYAQVMIDQSLKNIPAIYDLKFAIALTGLGLWGIVNLPLLKMFALDENRWYKL